MWKFLRGGLRLFKGVRLFQSLEYEVLEKIPKYSLNVNLFNYCKESVPQRTLPSSCEVLSNWRHRLKNVIWKSLPFDELPLAKGAYPVTWSNLNDSFTVTIARSFIHIPLIKPPCNVMFLTLCTPYFLSFFIHSFGVLAFGSSLLVFPVIIKFVNQTKYPRFLILSFSQLSIRNLGYLNQTM